MALHKFSYDAGVFWWTTAIFAILLICLIAMAYLPCLKENKSTVIVTAVGSVISFWILWFCTYAM
jgi:hypothetical protein